MTLTTLGYAFIGGLLPSFIWLYFLLKEDARHPEPKRFIVLAFIAGMLVVPLVLPFERYAQNAIANQQNVFIAWALIEESLKYAAAAVFILWRNAVDEAPDYVIYMITVALGFASVENMLFIAAPLLDGEFLTGLFTNNVRFLGSTLLHVVASATIGFTLAFSAKKGHLNRMLSAGAGLILAVGLHTLFNALIISQGASTTLAAFFLVWLCAVVLFAAFEVLKYFQYSTVPNKKN